MKDCIACGKSFVPDNPNAVFCGKECYRTHVAFLVFLGTMTCFGYTYQIVARTRKEAEDALLEEWKRQVQTAGTQDEFERPFEEIDFEYLHEWNGSSVIPTLLGKLIRP